MVERYNLKTSRKVPGRDKPFYTKVGVMYPMKNRDGFLLKFDALPIPQMTDDGDLEVKVFAYDATTDTANQFPSGNGGQQTPDVTEPAPVELDDKIPF